MRNSQGRAHRKPTSGKRQAGGGMNADHLKCLFVRKAWKQTAQSHREHRLAGSRRSHEQYVMPARGGNLERRRATI